MRLPLSPARGLVTDVIGRLRVARLYIASRPGSLRERRVGDVLCSASSVPLSRKGRGRLLGLIGAFLAMLALSSSAPGAKPGVEAELPRIGPAPGFTLIDQDGKRFSLSDVRGRVTVVTFIFTTCSETCPLLTAKLVGVQRNFRKDASKVFFTAISVDPMNDTPATLRKYAQAHSADLANFAFLTGTFEQIEDIARRYAVFRKAQENGSVDHTFLTSMIDQGGTLRVQYLGTRFDPGEFTKDIQSLLQEGAR